jgi:hypothetical protein
VNIVEKTYSIIYKSDIYDLLTRLKLTHQKAHADYGNAEKEEQIKFFNDLKNSILQANEERIVIKYDEFSISEKPTSSYGWAETKYSPQIRYERTKKSTEQTVSVAIDILNAEYFFQASNEGNALKK